MVDGVVAVDAVEEDVAATATRIQLQWAETVAGRRYSR